MPNSNKVKGDRAERAAMATCIRLGFPWTEKTRAGYTRDHGDLHLETVHGRNGGPAVIAQVKDDRTIRWPVWLGELAEQVRNAKADHGFLIVKRPGLSERNADQWLAVTTLADHLLLLRAAGYGTALTEDESVRLADALAVSRDKPPGEGEIR
jgi:hypothetical protein